ncbi:MAG: hypothetical protein UX62_C0043G0006 [Microgenomates group bacterium GW2011_GWA2_46_7]|nr:MAG: hypothetical protein UX62_C0043G0006 [Microgenomates group bacterium GW2011_GWA2_46_7]
MGKNNKSNKGLYIIIVVLVLIIVGGGLWFFFGKDKSIKIVPKGTQTPNSQSIGSEIDTTLSEQPNQEKFKEYFTSIYLAKLPIGSKFDPRNIIKTKVFTAGEQFCTSINMKKQVPAETLSSAIYDVGLKEDAQPQGGTFSQAMGPGNSTGCQSLIEATGKFEFKIYLNDILVSVLPFEVK